MIYCITLIIVVALVCATRLYPLWLRHDCRRYRKTTGTTTKNCEKI